MLKTISASALREQIRQVLTEVGYGQAQYIVEKFNEPAVAIINLADFRLLQALKQREATATLQERIAAVRGREVPAEELTSLIEEARSEFYALKHPSDDAD